MRIIALMNQKGGVGKTTTTVNLGAALAEAGKRVCLIDLDPQAHLTINYGVDPSPDMISLYDVLVDGRGFLEAVRKVDDKIALVPGSIDLAAAEIELDLRHRPRNHPQRKTRVGPARLRLHPPRLPAFPWLVDDQRAGLRDGSHDPHAGALPRAAGCRQAA
jgi:cellulose biosynthesis protein BcsQ